jgi:hypothetical protein
MRQMFCLVRPDSQNTLRLLTSLLLLWGIYGMAAEPIRWPDLASVAFVSGRPATEADVAQGRAVFVLKSGGRQIGKPIAMVLPQYAFHIEEKKREPCVLIQAEEAGGQRLAGCRLVSDDRLLAGLLDEFQLLGTRVPK